METAIFIGIGVVGFIAWSIKKGNLSFWKVAAKHPDEVFHLMTKNESVWVIDVGGTDIWNGKNKADYSGPFRLFVPSINSFAKIYGKADLIESAQEKIVKEVLPAHN